MSYLHEARLEREGFDNIENFSTADPVSLAVSTGFTYPQLAQWISIAWLVTHLREDYPKFVQHTGITSRDELVLFLTRWDGSLAHAVDQLTKDASSSQAILAHAVDQLTKDASSSSSPLSLGTLSSRRQPPGESPVTRA